jgi:hypothetical protein
LIVADDFDSAMSMGRQAQIGTNLTLDLPLDEDDYLMPQPPQPISTISSGNQAYMDILDSKMPGKLKRHENFKLLMLHHLCNIIGK